MINKLKARNSTTLHAEFIEGKGGDRWENLILWQNIIIHASVKTKQHGEDSNMGINLHGNNKEKTSINHTRGEYKGKHHKSNIISVPAAEKKTPRRILTCRRIKSLSGFINRNAQELKGITISCTSR